MGGPKSVPQWVEIRMGRNQWQPSQWHNNKLIFDIMITWNGFGMVRNIQHLLSWTILWYVCRLYGWKHVVNRETRYNDIHADAFFTLSPLASALKTSKVRKCIRSGHIIFVTRLNEMSYKWININATGIIKQEINECQCNKNHTHIPLLSLSKEHWINIATKTIGHCWVSILRAYTLESTLTIKRMWIVTKIHVLPACVHLN